MIRFVDLTAFYWADDHGPPCCAFLDTVTDRFVESELGDHTFDTLEEVQALGPRFVALVPDGFFKPELSA